MSSTVTDFSRTSISQDCPPPPHSNTQTPSTFLTSPPLPRHGPKQIYTADIAAFYPSTPHREILNAFDYFFTRNNEYELLKNLLAFNYVTDGERYFHGGNVGIPMGLTLAPQLARMTTAFLLRNFKVPSRQDVFTIYYDDLAATFPLDDANISNIENSLHPYILKRTEDNITQDARYDPSSKIFAPFKQHLRQSSICHPDSNHLNPNMITKTYLSSIFRAVRIWTQPRTTLSHLLANYLPLLEHLGHQPRNVIQTMVENTYFPMTNAIRKNFYGTMRRQQQQQKQQQQQPLHFTTGFATRGQQWSNYGHCKRSHFIWFQSFH